MFSLKEISYLAITCFACLCLAASPLFSDTYYVDSIDGDDVHTGLSPDQAWRSLHKVNNVKFEPGDKILFKSDGFWRGQLWPKGSGLPGKPIQIDMYGKGHKPIINGGGTVTHTVRLYNQQYWQICNLEITNYKGGDASLKNGVYVAAKDIGTVHHIHLKNLYIHSVNGDMTTKHNGGIFFEILGDSVKTRFDDFLIEGCQIHDVDRTGISNNSTWSSRTLEEDGDWYPSTNLVFRNNWIENTGANGLIVRVAKHPIIEHNVFKRCGLKGSGNASFPFNCDDALFQYNESYLTVFNPGDADAGGFDSDWRCKRSVFQYNYSHDNDYGFILICCMGGGNGFNDGTIIRYNISQNDNGFVFKTSGPAANTMIYNNTVYVGEKMKNNKIDRRDDGIPKICFHKSWNGYSDGTHYLNNIFYNLSEQALYNFGESTDNFFDYNVFYGFHPDSEPEDAHKISSDPLLVKPGSGAVGLNSLPGYQLKDDSPCIDTGLEIPENGGMDFWGNPLYRGKPDRGACEKQ